MARSILLVTQYFYPENFRINDIVKSLVQQGLDVVVLTGCPNYPNGVAFNGYTNTSNHVEIHSDGYPIHRVPIVLRGAGSSVRLLLNYLSFIVSGIIFGISSLRNKKFDLIFVYAPSPILQSIVGIYFKYSRNVPLITWVQDLWPESIQFTGRVSNKRILGCLANLVSWIYKNNDLLLAQSRGFLKPIQEKYGPIDVAYFPNPGEERDSYSPAAGVKNFDFFLPIGFNVVFAGNLGSVQSIPTILNAAEILRDHPGIRIILVGSGSLSQWLASEIESRKLKNVVLAGRYPADVMPAIFNQASALLVSLNSDPLLNQTIPAKLQSYLASGKPIIASLDGEGAQIVLDAKAGITCPTENPVALADAIEKLSNMSPDQLVNMGASGRRYFAENFDLQILVKKLIDIFDQTISRYSKKI